MEFALYKSLLLLLWREEKQSIWLSQDMRQIPPTSLVGSQYFVTSLSHLSGCTKGDVIFQAVKSAQKLIFLNVFQILLIVIVG